MEVHSKSDYDRHVAPYSSGVFPGAMLKVTVNDVPCGHLVGAVPSRAGTSTASAAREVVLSRPTSSVSSAYAPSYIVSTPPALSPAGIPPPPILFHSTTSASPAPSTVVPSRFSTRTSVSCCEVSQKKNEMRDVLASFLRDFDRIASTFEVSAGSVIAQSSSTDVSPTSQGTRNVSPAPSATPQPKPMPAPRKQTAPSTAESLSVVHRGIMCDGCRNTITGPRFKCMKCKGLFGTPSHNTTTNTDAQTSTSAVVA
jgi:hypothetical protein